MALARVNGDAEDWDAGRRMLIVSERATGRFLGRVGILDWPQFGETEVGWIFRRACARPGLRDGGRGSRPAVGVRAPRAIPYVTALDPP